MRTQWDDNEADLKRIKTKDNKCPDCKGALSYVYDRLLRDRGRDHLLCYQCKSKWDMDTKERYE